MVAPLNGLALENGLGCRACEAYAKPNQGEATGALLAMLALGAGALWMLGGLQAA